MSKKIILVLTLTFIACAVNAQKQNSKRYPEIKLKEISANKLDTFLVKGSIKLIFKCPPCPEGAQCKPCIGDHVDVTDGENHLRIFTHQLESFKVSRKYVFLVRFRNEFHREDNVELIRAIN